MISPKLCIIIVMEKISHPNSFKYYFRHYFKDTAHDLVENGWSVHPQHKLERKPVTCSNKSIKIFDENEKIQLDIKLPTAEALKDWSMGPHDPNVAVVFGEASGKTFAVDLDIDDEKLSQQAQDIATEIFGITPLQRVGREPRIALIYRSPPDADLIINRGFKTLDNVNGIDILSRRKSLTVFGKHRFTNRYYYWLDKSPLEIKPFELPIVTQEQVNLFILEINEIMPLKNPEIKTNAVSVNSSHKIGNIDLNKISELNIRFDAPDDANKACISYRIHAKNIREFDIRTNQKRIKEGLTEIKYSQNSIMLMTIKRMIVCGWSSHNIAIATDIEANQNRKDYTSNAVSTLKNITANQSYLDEIRTLIDHPYHSKNWINLEIKNGARDYRMDRIVNINIISEMSDEAKEFFIENNIRFGGASKRIKIRNTQETVLNDNKNYENNFQTEILKDIKPTPTPVSILRRKFIINRNPNDKTDADSDEIIKKT